MSARFFAGMLFVTGVAAAMFRLPAPTPCRAEPPLQELKAGFHHPPMTCRPHTRWWWMGNATTCEGLDWELTQMHAQGIGGVEQITMQEVYRRGNVPYLSHAYFDRVTHAIHTAKKLGMEFSLNFGGPGWVFGGAWVPAEDRNQNLLSSSIDVVGPGHFTGTVSTDATLNPRDLPRSTRKIRPEDRLVAVVAGKLAGGRLIESSLVDLTARVRGRKLAWPIPAGRWRVMAFWLTWPQSAGVVDHFNKAAMQRYCDYLGGKFQAAFGDEFGKTVDSLFCDSLEVPIFRNGIYWNERLLDEFKARKGYDLTRYLPALWWQVGAVSPRIRYDVNEFLHTVAMEAFFKTFLGWCEAHGVKGRIQPYGITADIIQSAGVTHIPEMEVTAGEKDAVPWFDTRIGPKKYVASGAHLYGRNIVSVEAYTYLHWQPCRATLEELKIASDVFLRSGANKFYNHGFTSSPERQFAPSRRFGAEMLISPPNVWWQYYHLLSDYIARCSYMLRQGHFVADVGVYSPLANQWTLDVFNARKWTRGFDWGDLGKLLIGNGYDFDLINDDVLQNRATISDASLRVGPLRYRILILPNIGALPLASMRRIEQFARQGGVVIALERVPEWATGLKDYRQRDAAVRTISEAMFRPPRGRDGTGSHEYGTGRTYWIKRVIDRRDVLERRRSALDPFVRTLRHHLPPDFGIDFVREGLRENPGLTFIHRRLDAGDLYFVTNIQDRPSRVPVTFRVYGARPWRWDPGDGSVVPIFQYRQRKEGIEIPLRLGPYASTMLVFAKSGAVDHVVDTNFAEIVGLKPGSVDALADQNGDFHVAVTHHGQVVRRTVRVDCLPAPFVIDGKWNVMFESSGCPRLERTVAKLRSWTDDPATKHFSGTGRYTIVFQLPSAYTTGDLQLELDLGQVGNVAEVKLNGADVGTRWLRGQMANITGSVHPGTNELVVLVTNTLINRVAGLRQPPPVPESLVSRYGKSRAANLALAGEVIGFEPLPPSGLIGPVRIIARRKATVALP